MPFLISKATNISVNLLTGIQVYQTFVVGHFW